MGALSGLSTVIILLSIAAALPSTSADPESSALDGDRLVGGLVDDFEDEDERLTGGEELKRAAFRSDLGKRDDDDDDNDSDSRQIRDTRARSRYRSFNKDLGKRRGGYMFRSDLGRRSTWDPQAAAAVSSRLRDMERRRAMFRSDLGKRDPYSYSRRMFRTDLGKRPMFRHDLG